MIQKAIGWFGAIFAILMIVCQPALVLGDEPENSDEAEWVSEGPHEVGLFLGVTDKDGDLGTSIGIDYEYRFHEMFGIGGLLEYTGSDFREGVACVPFFWHPWRELAFVGAPGIEMDAADGTDSFLVRVGVEYGFAIGSGYKLVPEANFDFTRDEDTVVVIGASIARSF